MTPPRDHRNIGNLTEGLHPWQPKKLYYLTDAAHDDFLKDRGPRYSSTEISPSKKVAYEQLGAEECAFHLTQSDSGHAAATALQKHQVEKTYLHNPVQFILGKAYATGSVTSDVFEGVTPGPIDYRAAPGFREAHISKATFKLGGPWHFYPQFWHAHGIGQLADLVPPEFLAGASTTVSIPVLIDNPGEAALDGTLTAEFPAGWRLRSSKIARFHVDGGDEFSGRIVAVAPEAMDSTWRQIKISAQIGTESLGSHIIRVQVGAYSLPQ